MPLPRYLFLWLLLWPVLEIYLLIQVGAAIGAWYTIGLLLAAAILGVQVMRRQGMTVMRRARQLARQGELPAAAMLEGLVLLVSGVLLLLPGFFSDVIGLLGLLPPLRHAIVRRFLRNSAAFHSAAAPGTGSSTEPPRRSDPATLEGEYKREDD